MQMWWMHGTGRLRVCVWCMDGPDEAKAGLPPRGIEQPASTALVATVVAMVVVRMLISSGSPAEAMDGRKASRL